MKQTLLSIAFLATLAASASAGELRFSLAVRETNNAAGTAIGANGGAAGTIEFVGRDPVAPQLDQKLVPADGAWHAVSFNLNTELVRGFTGDGILTSTTGLGVFESLRIANTTDGITRYKVYIDDVVNTVNGNPTTITDFEGFSVGTEALFQEPRFSGSTSAKLLMTPDIARVTDSVAFAGAKSYETEFEFISDIGTDTTSTGGNWVRLTTNGLANLPNPVIGVPGSATNTSTVSMQIRVVAVPEPVSLALVGLALGSVVTVARRRR
ncbi:MAG: PEP-CTERM sorting domain-containing protein [Pirellulales bacterium]